MFWYLILIKYADKRELFKKAIATQSAYMKDASIGKGIDRHMLGMRCVLKPDEISKATMFTDPSYIDTMTFRLSTSNMSPGTYFWGGFGPVVSDGYGVNYAIGKDDLKFSISSKCSCTSTNSYKFRKTLEQALIDMLILFPKRSEVWGPTWREDQLAEKREASKLNKMKELSDQLKAKQSAIASKYNK